MEKILEKNKTFAEDVFKGLSSRPKFLSSKYFYNERGDELFQAIMNLEEYYLTRSEYNIFEHSKEEIASSFAAGRQPFNIIELGAGDGYKTKVLLKYFLEQHLNFKYMPIDISANVLETLKSDLEENFNGLNVQPYQGDYFDALKDLNYQEDTRKIVLFLGSNIGNFKDLDVIEFLKNLSKHLTDDDKVFIGFDLKKDPHIIRDAYNDKSGITKAFNLNLLQRINDELGGDFNLEKFIHYPVYDPLTGQAKSYLVSTVEQKVTIDALNKSFSFKQWEPIFMEVSQKYNMGDIEKIAFLSGFKIEKNFFDDKKYFVDSLWVKVDH
jgi:dimethylhistidine N-methyltransferase